MPTNKSAPSPAEVAAYERILNRLTLRTGSESAARLALAMAAAGCPAK